MSLSIILVSSYMIPVLADTPLSDSHHDTFDLNGDHRAILLKFSGNGGSFGWKADSLNNGLEEFGFQNYINPDPANKLENFMESNAGTHHDSAWNQFHFPDDRSNQNFDAGKSPPANIADCNPCNWVQAKADALAYIILNPQKKIVLTGFSFGGGAATFLAEDLQHIRQVEGVLLNDPVGPGIIGASRAGVAQQCNIGLTTPVDSDCLASEKPFRAMNANIKVIFAAYQIDDPLIPPDAKAYSLNDWAPHIVGPFAADGSFVCDGMDAGECHGEIGFQAPLQPNFIAHLNQFNNAKPSISISSGPITVLEGENTQLEIETLSEDPFAFLEHTGDMRLFPRLDSLNNGIEPFSLIENGSFETGTVFGSWDEQSGQFVLLGVGDTNLAPWEITSGTVDHVFRTWIAPDGSKSLDMSGDPGPTGAISQTFDTIEVETNYRVNFDVSANPQCSPRIMRLNVQAGDTPLEQIIVSNAGRSKPQMNWEHKSYLFSASGPTATIHFTSTDTSGCGVTLDNVVITKASSLETGTVLKTNSIEKQATFLINVNEDDGPATHTRTVWVEDNGWPCDDCTSTDDSIDGGATGKWNSDEFTITVINVPPTLIHVGGSLDTQTRSNTFTFNAIDPSAADQAAGFKYVITWWDGTQSTIDELTVGDVSFTGPDIKAVGDYTFLVTAEDKDGGKTDPPVEFTISITDSDGDGIADGVDTLPEEFSDDFSDVNFCEVGTPNVDTGLCEIEPSCSFGDFNPETDKCETVPLCDADFIYNPETNSCEMDDQMLEPSCIDNENQDFNPDTDVCEASPICPGSTELNSETNMCQAEIIPGDTEGTIIDRGDQDVSVINEFAPDGVYIGTFSFEDGQPLQILSADDGSVEKSVQIQVLEPDPGAPAEISVCGNSALLRLTFQDSTIVTCSSVTIEALTGSIDAEFKVLCRTHTTTLTPGQILTFDPSSFLYTNSGISEIIIKTPGEIPVAVGESKRIGAGCGGENHEPPTIGKNLAGTKQMVENGFCIDADCFTVTKLFHEEFQLYEMMSGTHTLSTLVYCAQGVGHCNYSAIGIMPYDKDMNDAVWKIEMKGNHLGEWTPVIYDPEGFLGEVTITTQIISDKFLSVSYTIEFKNKQTPPMKVGVQLRDDKHGVRNFYFNEGVKFNDSDAYPYVETLFEQSIEVKPLCINPQPHDRDSCGFELVRDWTQKKAQDLLNDMQNGNYIYDKYVRDRYYD